MQVQHAISTLKKPGIIVNASAGSTSDITREVSELLKQYDFENFSVDYVEAQYLNVTIESALDAGSDVIITYGGDGTSLSAARQASKHGISIVPLPGGTMNVLPKAIYGTDVWQDVLKIALEDSSPQWIPMGEIAGHSFLVAAILGTASRLGIAREAIRELDIVTAAKEVMNTISDTSPDDTFNFTNGVKTMTSSTNLLQVTCPLMNDHADRRGTFEVVSVDADKYTDLAGLGMTAIASNWRDDAVVETYFLDETKVSGPKTLDILVDGEHEEISLPAKISLMQQGVKILSPKSFFGT